MTVEIHETKIAKGADATIVQLHIADAPLSENTGTFRLDLVVHLPHYKHPFVLQIQREAILEAREVLGKLADALLQELPRDANARPA
jgi:hypothetical protein